MTEEKQAFFYGTLTFSAADTEERFPVEVIGEAEMYNVKSPTNNVIPERGSKVPGLLFKVESFDDLDRFESEYGYERIEAKKPDGTPVSFYTTVPESFKDFDAEVIVSEK